MSGLDFIEYRHPVAAGYKHAHM
jgi:hypothetical protein